MTAAKRLPPSLVRAMDRSKNLGIRVGSADHRFIGVWVVVVGNRAYLRSWDRRPDGWHARLQNTSLMTVQVGQLTRRVRAVAVRSERVWDAVDAAYAAKYDTPGALRYVRGFRRPARRATTTELVPV